MNLHNSYAAAGTLSEVLLGSLPKTVQYTTTAPVAYTSQTHYGRRVAMATSPTLAEAVGRDDLYSQPSCNALDNGLDQESRLHYLLRSTGL